MLLALVTPYVPVAAVVLLWALALRPVLRAFRLPPHAVPIRRRPLRRARTRR